MSSPSNPLRIGAALMVGAVLVPTGMLGVVGVVNDAGPMRPVWGMMAFGGLMGVYGAVSTVREALREGRAERERTADARAGSDTTYVVARWSVGGSAGRGFADAEWARRKREVAVGAAGLFVLGSAFLWWTQDGPPWAAFAAGLFVAALYLAIGLAKYGLEHQASRGAGADEVLVLPDAVVVLGTWHALAGDRRLRDVRLVEDALELSIEWDTRDGTANDVIRVPVPAEARERAEEAAAYLRVQLVA